MKAPAISLLVCLGFASVARAGAIEDELDACLRDMRAPPAAAPGWIEQEQSAAHERALRAGRTPDFIHAAAESPAPQWHGFLELYVWLPISSSGTAQVNGPRSSSASAQRDVAQVGGGDAVDVDGVSGWAIPFRAHVRRGQWGINVDFVYGDLNLKGDLLGQLGIPFDMGLRLTMLDLAVSWTPLVPEPEKQRWLVQLYAGARFVTLKMDLTVGSSAREGRSENDVAPLVGGYFGYAFSEAWLVILRTDFGISSNFSYNVHLGAAWRFGKEHHWMLNFGWRVTGVDFEAGGANAVFKADLTLNGPFVGFAWTF